MTSCELCGKETMLLQVEIEGNLFSTCSSCAKHGKILDHPTPAFKQQKNITRPVSGPALTFVEDLGGKIKQAREERRLTQIDLAKLIAERESLITKIESGQYTPELRIIRKLEQFFSIKLTEAYTHLEEEHINFEDTHLTIGDLLKKKEQ